MSSHPFITSLKHVTQVAPGKWRAECPAHKSKHHTQSLAVRALEDGTLLIRCHAGCGAADVVGAVNMKLADLFPPGHHAPHDPRHPQKTGHWFALREAVQTLKHEILVVAIAAREVADGKSLSQQDTDRVALAADRIRSALEACL